MPKPALAFVIAHYHPTGRVPLHLFNLVQNLRIRSPRVVFVSTGITDDEIARLAPFAQVIRRENFGYDFWSYRVGIEALGDLAGIDRLILLNSSFVTLYPYRLIPHFEAPITGPRVRALSDCRHPVRHLQSYCLMFDGPTLLASEAFRGWWAALTPLSDREEVVSRQELGLSAHFLAARVRMVPVFEPTPNDLAKGLCRLIAGTAFNSTVPNISADGLALLLKLETARELNPTHFLWDALMDRTGIVKVELVRDNPMNIGLEQLRKVLGRSERAAALMEDALIGETPRAPGRRLALQTPGL